MNQVFGSVYADAYDLLYREKDYDKECDLLRRIFQRYKTASICNILDLGCGTGNHALRLIAKGYRVFGVDRSADMLRLAERKAQASGVIFQTRHADLRDVDLAEKFDAILMMFAVLGYQVEDADLLGSLHAVRRHVQSDGLLVFDAWYGPAVLRQRPEERVRVIETKEGTLLRHSSGELDIPRRICTVRFHLQYMNGDRMLKETKESHSVRYFFSEELELFLKTCGFRLLRLGAFPDFDRDPDDTTWSVIAVAKAV